MSEVSRFSSASRGIRPETMREKLLIQLSTTCPQSSVAVLYCEAMVSYEDKDCVFKSEMSCWRSSALSPQYQPSGPFLKHICTDRLVNNLNYLTSSFPYLVCWSYIVLCILHFEFCLFITKLKKTSCHFFTVLALRSPLVCSCEHRHITGEYFSYPLFTRAKRLPTLCKTWSMLDSVLYAQWKLKRGSPCAF